MQSGWEEKYYLNQAGSGFSPFAGIRFQRGNGFTPYSGHKYQKGNGFLGRIWKGVTLPLLKYIGRHGLEAAGNIVTEARSNPDDIKQIVKKEARKFAGKAVEDSGKRLSTYIQTGKGLSTRRPPPSKLTTSQYKKEIVAVMKQKKEDNKRKTTQRKTGAQQVNKKTATKVSAAKNNKKETSSKTKQIFSESIPRKKFSKISKCLVKRKKSFLSLE